MSTGSLPLLHAGFKGGTSRRLLGFDLFSFTADMKPQTPDLTGYKQSVDHTWTRNAEEGSEGSRNALKSTEQLNTSHFILFSTLLCSVLPYSALLYSILFCPVLSYSIILSYFVLLWSTFYCTVLFCSIILYSFLYCLFYSILLCSVLSCCILLYPILFCSILFSSVPVCYILLLYSVLCYARSNREQGHFLKGPAEGAIGSNVITAFVAGVMVTAQKRWETDFAQQHCCKIHGQINQNRIFSVLDIHINNYPIHKLLLSHFCDTVPGLV